MQFDMVIHFKSTSYPLGQGKESSEVSSVEVFQHTECSWLAVSQFFCWDIKHSLELKWNEGVSPVVKGNWSSISMEVYQSDKNNANTMLIIMQSIIDIAFMKDETRDE